LTPIKIWPSDGDFASSGLNDFITNSSNLEFVCLQPAPNQRNKACKQQRRHPHSATRRQACQEKQPEK
jgi:hypothetical protein